MMHRSPLIEALGGEAGCRSLSAAFYSRVAGDPELRPLLPGKTLRCATEEFSAFLVQFLGGDEEMTQYRWWLSLRESHGRFQITESQRLAWLKQMQAALEASQLDAMDRQALLQFFVSSSAYLLGDDAVSVEEPDLAARWRRARAIDDFVASILAERDVEVLAAFQEFADSPSQLVGVLARMMQTARPTLVEAVGRAIEQAPSLGLAKFGGRTLLHYAAGAGNKEIVALLLSVGVDANVLDRGHHSPLYRLADECAADSGPQIVQLLVSSGADVDHCGGVTRCTPLHMAARRGHEAVARTLLDLGASADARDVKGCTPLDRAVRCRKTGVVDLLRRSTSLNAFG